MTAPNRNTLWAEVLVDELVAAGVDAVCLAPGSRSTPLTVAFARHDDVRTYSHLDERSAAFFALGRGRATGRPTPLVCTSGTAAANFHPAVLEATESEVPLLLLTADRPPELRDSGANQTTDQEKLYGDAVRWYRTLPEPAPDARKLRSLRVTAARAVAASTGTPPGPVHLNVPFRKPLEPTKRPGDVPAELGETDPVAVDGRDGPFVAWSHGESHPPDPAVRELREAVESTTRGLIVCGPADRPTPGRASLGRLADATGFPVLADPLSGHRFGPHLADAVVCGGYDSYLGATAAVPAPELVVRFGASPTSKPLRTFLAGVDARGVLVDPAGGWPEAEFRATDLIESDPDQFVTALLRGMEKSSGREYRALFEQREREYWEHVEAACESLRAADADGGGDSEELFEGAVVREVSQRCPDGTALFVSNSMPVRDLDRFGEPRTASIDVFGNRGVSGIDGITSTALGVGSARDGPLVLLIGDIAFYHDMNGLLALQRCDVDATIVVLNNDGGGIFHKLPIESFDPPFTEQFLTPHGLDFEPTGELYGFPFERYGTLPSFADAFEEAVNGGGTQVLSVRIDSERSHRARERLQEEIVDSLGSD